MKKSIGAVLFALAIVVGLDQVASGGLIPVPVNNASFEAPIVTSPMHYEFVTPADWIVGSGHTVVANNLVAVITATDGAQVVSVQEDAGTADIYQDVGKLQSNTTYLLTVDVIGQAGSGSSGSIGLVNGTTDAGSPLGSPTVLSSSVFTTTAAGGNVIGESFMVKTGLSVSGDLTIVLTGGGAFGSTIANYDNVNLSIVTPEPGSALLLGLGAVGMLFFARRCRRVLPSANICALFCALTPGQGGRLA